MELSNGMRMVRGEASDGLLLVLIDTGSGVIFVDTQAQPSSSLGACQEIVDTVLFDLLDQTTVVSSVSLTMDEFMNLRPTSTPGPSPTPVPDYTANGIFLGESQHYASIGHYEQDNDMTNGPEKLEWTVVARENGKALLVSCAIDKKPYHGTGEAVTWETCDLRQWLNGEFYDQTFTAAEKSLILETVVTNPDNPNTGADGGNDMVDRIFLLSLDEALYYFPPSGAFRFYATPYALAQRITVSRSNDANWLTRTPGMNNEYVAYYGRNILQANYAGHLVNVNTQYSGTQPAIKVAMWVKVDEPRVETEDPFCQEGAHTSRITTSPTAQNPFSGAC